MYVCVRCAVSAPKDESLSVCIGRGLQRHRCMHHRPPPPPKGKGHGVCVLVCVMVEGHKTEQHQSSWTCGAVSSKRSEAELNRPFIKCCSVWRVAAREAGQAKQAGNKPACAERPRTLGLDRISYRGGRGRYAALCGANGRRQLPCPSTQQSAARGSNSQARRARSLEEMI